MLALTGAPEVGASELLLAALLILLNVAADLALKLGLGRRLLTAALRATVQLFLLGLVLGWVFDAERGALVLVLGVGMALLAGWEAMRRAGHRIRGLAPLAMGTMLASSMVVTLYGTQVVLAVEPWYAPRYVIPILGMVLGNALNGVSLGLDTALRGFRSERARIELLLAHGASRSEAARDVVRAAVRTGTIPILNAMIATGIIAIPGMMTGQLLAGESPQTAAAYQLFILFCIAGGVALGTIGVVLGSVRLVFDERDRLRLDRLTSRAD